MNGRTATLALKGILAATLCLAACDSNEGPVVMRSIPNQTVAVGETVDVDLSGHFSDPDGDGLSYAATSSDEGVATASATGASLTVAAVGQGTATVTVTTTDPGGLSAEQAFSVTVPNRAPTISEIHSPTLSSGPTIRSWRSCRTTSPTRTATTSPTRYEHPTETWPGYANGATP